MSLYQLEQPRLALPYFLRAVELDEQDASAHFQYGLCLAQAGHIQEAKKEFEKTIDLDQHHADAYYNLGVAYAFEENREEALKMFDMALSIQPDHLLAGNGKRLLEEMI